MSSIRSDDATSFLVMNQFRALIFMMQDAWPQIHARGSEAVRTEWSALRRSHGEFAEKPVRPSDFGNMRLYQALREGAQFVLGELFLGHSLQASYVRVLRDHLSLDCRIRRLAFVNEWSDQMLGKVLAHLRALPAHLPAHLPDHLAADLPDQVLQVMQRSADDLALAGLRGGHGGLLTQHAASSLGFASSGDLFEYLRANPPLSQSLKARPAVDLAEGSLIAASLTEVVFEGDAGVFFVERAKLKVDPLIGDWLVVGERGAVQVTPSADLALPGTRQGQQERPRQRIA